MGNELKKHQPITPDVSEEGVSKDEKQKIFGKTRKNIGSIINKPVSLYRNIIDKKKQSQDKKKYLQYNRFEILKDEDLQNSTFEVVKYEDYNVEKNTFIKEKEVAIINLFGIPYVGRIISHNEEDKNVCYCKFIDKDGSIRSGYVKKDSINPGELFEEIRNRKGNLKEGDNVFIPYGEGIIVGTIIGKEKDKYKIGVGIVSKNGEKQVDVVRKNATEINEYNEEIINELDGNNNTTLHQNLEESPENLESLEKFNIGKHILIQPDENSLIFEGEIIPGAENERLVNVKYKDENGNIQTRFNISKEKLKRFNMKYQLRPGKYYKGKYIKVPFEKGVVLGKIIEKYGDKYYKIEIINKLNYMIDLEEGNLDELNKPGNKVEGQE